MSNKNFGFPLLLGMITPDPTDPAADPTPVIGGGSVVGPKAGQNGGKAPFACSFETWSANFASDQYKDGIIDFNDYGQWWADNGLGAEAWENFNTGLPFNWQSKND